MTTGNQPNGSFDQDRKLNEEPGSVEFERGKGKDEQRQRSQGNVRNLEPGKTHQNRTVGNSEGRQDAADQTPGNQDTDVEDAMTDVDQKQESSEQGREISRERKAI
jgi:hypothetical protein